MLLFRQINISPASERSGEAEGNGHLEFEAPQASRGRWISCRISRRNGRASGTD
ncbi:hypothetical protein PENSUB_6702 [Penicillium subrubescens]|uniref:Uncharacterized protein n=1 Tax=Penicillium subrubescens TaxID=1316194 RepID=A0A1Q5TXJ4_9EURO|nr:hypothetical protein PENSUB_6702 [Penicillium subrubescens]